MNGILIMDKPQGFTSHDVVAKLRGICKTRRIGHTGTLDPMATGVLPVFIGRATRACEFATGDDKTYLAHIRLGVTTDTQDITGETLSTSPVTCTEEDVRAVCASFVGEISQIPPMYSAIKIGGKKLYELARDGIEIERAPRNVTIHSIEVSPISNEEYALTVHCSKGTYIRTLCADIGEKLSCGACLSSLRRTQAGAYTIEQVHTFEQIGENPEAFLLPVDSLFLQHPAIKISGKSEQKCRNGAPVPCSEVQDGTLYRVYNENGEFLMLARGENRTLRTVKSFFEVS
ncbi:MAG: tRNA pseudouridine(55) synthase TruB [Ruminococcaceae bacterium]|nr:tRNA pseudouridine(55) synthase TruB [Oscillospiraceae bacterium]